MSGTLSVACVPGGRELWSRHFQ